MHSQDGSLQDFGKKNSNRHRKDFEGAADKSAPGKRQPDAADGQHRQFVSGRGYLMSACWMMRPTLFDEVGLLDENIFYAPEDVEFCIRVWKKGKRVLYCPQAQILHHWQRLSPQKALEQAQLGAPQRTWIHVPQTQFFTFKQKDRTVNLLKIKVSKRKVYAAHSKGLFCQSTV